MVVLADDVDTGPVETDDGTVLCWGWKNDPVVEIAVAVWGDSADNEEDDVDEFDAEDEVVDGVGIVLEGVGRGLVELKRFIFGGRGFEGFGNLDDDCNTGELLGDFRGGGKLGEVDEEEALEVVEEEEEEEERVETVEEDCDRREGGEDGTG